MPLRNFVQKTSFLGARLGFSRRRFVLHNAYTSLTPQCHFHKVSKPCSKCWYPLHKASEFYRKCNEIYYTREKDFIFPMCDICAYLLIIFISFQVNNVGLQLLLQYDFNFYM